MEDKKQKKKLFENVKIFQKLKSIKHIELIVAVVLGAIVLLIYLSTFGTKKAEKTSFQATSTTEYSAMLETKLESILKQINGVGNVSVMVTLESGPEYVYATDEEEKTNTSEDKGT